MCRLAKGQNVVPFQARLTEPWVAALAFPLPHAAAFSHGGRTCPAPLPQARSRTPPMNDSSSCVHSGSMHPRHGIDSYRKRVFRQRPPELVHGAGRGRHDGVRSRDVHVAANTG